MTAQIIAHRGVHSGGRANTLDAFTAAIAAGADGIELDVRLTGDGELVVYHDECLPALPGAAEAGQPVSDRSLADLQNALARAGGGNAATLDAVLALCAREAPYITVLIDVKSTPWDRERRRTGDTVLAALKDRVLQYPAPQHLVIASFDWEALSARATELRPARVAFHTMAARWLDKLNWAESGVEDVQDVLAFQESWRQGRGPGNEALSLLAMIRQAGGEIWSCYHRDLTSAAIATAHQHGLEVWAWTVNRMPDVRRAVALGASAVLTDDAPAVMLALRGVPGGLGRA